MLKKFFLAALPLADWLFALFVYPAAFLLKTIRRLGVQRLPASRRALFQVGVFPIRNHYYEPRFDYGPSESRFPRSLPGIDWNVDGQLAFMSRFKFADEIGDWPNVPAQDGAFSLANENFRSGDAEYWYQIIRTVKPRLIIEIGSGQSTLIATRAVAANLTEDPDEVCRHICIEPYEMPWLENTGVDVVRRLVETLPLEFFSELAANDILFIDSSHVIRSGGDVLFEYLELLPTLAPGVIVHVHDIFSPRDYPAKWIEREVRLWNEQYLLEAFLSHNPDWEILGALNLLHHAHPSALRRVAPSLTNEHEPGSFYLRRRPRPSNG